MNTRAIIFTIILANVAFACHRQTPVATPPSQAAEYQSEQHAVVAALIRQMYLIRGLDPVRQIVIENPDPCPALDAKVLELRQRIETAALRRLSDVSPDTINDFQARRQECHPLTRNLDLSVEYVLVGTKEMEQIFPKDNPNEVGQTFSAKYPLASGIIDVSNPGFNGDRTQAIISTGLWCGSRCGESHLVLLTKDRGAWNIKTKIETWVS
jgi:hypothetical protein